MTDTKLRIITVLKSGRAEGLQPPEKVVEYKPEHVIRLRDQFFDYYDGPECEFVCLSDVDVPGVTTIPLMHGWPGWWSKIEMFRSEVMADQNFYMDLDTTIQGDVTEMVTYPHAFTVLRNLSEPKSGKIGSGLMAWRRKMRPDRMYERFSRQSIRQMAKYTERDRWGDQGYLYDNMPFYFQIMQDLFPGAVASSKMSTPDEREAAAVICYHGMPKPWDE